MSEQVQSKNTKTRVLIILVLNLLVLSSLIVLAFYYSTTTNTLENNKKWFSKKTMLDHKVMGAIATMETHRALAGNQLDLGVWHGNQEFFLKDVEPYTSLSFKAKLTEKSNFSFFYNQVGDTLFGIRISTQSALPSMSFSVLKGEFLHKQPLNFVVTADKWILVRFEQIETGFGLFLDEKIMAQIVKPELIEWNAFGLRGSERSVLIDNVLLKSSLQDILLEEKFNKKLFPPLIIALIILCIILLNALLYSFRKHAKWLAAMALFGVLFILGYYFYFKIFRQFQYPEVKKNTVKVLPIKEKDSDVAKLYQNKKKKNNELRIMFIGTSQTYGSGASTVENTFVDLIETQLNYYNNDTIFDCINASVEGQTSTEMLLYYRYLQPIIQPDFVVVNLSYNDNFEDETYSKFKENIQTFIDLNKAINTGIVLIPEPSNPYHQDEILNERVKKTRYLMESIGKANQVPVIKMQPFIEEHFDDGFLFWDVVHLTDFGQKLFAEELLRQINSLD
jgi:lysophospholipase L1-like esterase